VVKKSSAVIISPSGKFYGSEQVLFDFLCNSSFQYEVYVPANSDFEKRLSQGKHIIKGFPTSNLPVFYLQFFFKLLFGKIKTVYVNEGGHIKYILLLARLLPRKKFIVHIRMIYDAVGGRLGTRVQKNLQLVAISRYIAGEIDKSWGAEVVFDPFAFSKSQEDAKAMQKLRIGVIGRISATKGFDLAHRLIIHLDAHHRTDMEFHFFGEPANDENIKQKMGELKILQHTQVHFAGYRSRSEIFNSIDAVVHFCLEEGLGRIYLEAIDAGRPFIGFKSGGLIEIAHEFELQEQLIPFDKENYIPALEQAIDKILQDYAGTVSRIREKKDLKYKLFSVETYCSFMEHKLNQV
jgi:hypothetical protein